MSQPTFFRRIATPVLIGSAAAGLLLLDRTGRAGARDPREPDAAPVIGLQQLAMGLGSVTSITNAGDARLFLTTQAGQIRIYSGGVILPTPFLDISANITSGGERGLLSVAFHPQYASNGRFFVYYTNLAGDIELARYQRSIGNPNVADLAGVVLLTIPHPTTATTTAASSQFGPDGYLYIGTGDGGAGNDPPCNAQNDGSALGKLLRIDVDAASPPFYAVPTTNPHYVAGNITDPFQLTWAKGLRNPWRFSFDRTTGDLWIGDVGQNALGGDRLPASRERRRRELRLEDHGRESLRRGWNLKLQREPDSASVHHSAVAALYPARLRVRPRRRAVLGDGRVRLSGLPGPRPPRHLPLRRLLLRPDLGQWPAPHAERPTLDDLRRRRRGGAVHRDWRRSAL